MKAALLSLILVTGLAHAQPKPTGPCYSCRSDDSPAVQLARAEANYAAECHMEASDCFYYYQLTSELDSASLYHFIVSQLLSGNLTTHKRDGHYLGPPEALLHDALVLKRIFKSSRGVFWASYYHVRRLYYPVVTRDPRLDLRIVAELEEFLKHWECEGYDCGDANFQAQMQKVIDDCAARKAYETKRIERMMRNKGQDSLVTYPPSGGF